MVHRSENVGMKIEVLFDARKKALARLVEKYGTVADFCRAFDLNEDRVRHLLRGHRNFGEKAAREMEEICGLPDFFFDMEASAVPSLISLFSHLDDRDKQEVERLAEILTRQKKSSA